MPTPSSKLAGSSQALMSILSTAPDLRSGPGLTEILHILAQRRTMDLSDLGADDQAALIAARASELLPGREQLAGLLASARQQGRQLIVKFGIDPTAADVHVGHAVPMIIAARFQRMGHRVVFIVGDVTAKIGDPSGRVSDRPALSDEDIQRNLKTYREQVTPFFDFTRADFRFNGEWLAPLTLPQFIGILQEIPLSASLQREDFRSRLSAGSGLTMAELVYSVVMALDSVEIAADIELGGIDQLLNMQMCRRVMVNAGQVPETVIATPLIEGTDGTGVKMSKSKGNYVGLAFEPRDVFGRLMSIPDRLVPDYLRALTEMLDSEIGMLADLVASKRIHPMGPKTLLASDVTSTIHGLEAAAAALAGFRAQFSARRFSDAHDLPAIERDSNGTSSVAVLLAQTVKLVSSLSEVRRVAAGGGLRLVVEVPGHEPESVSLTTEDAGKALDDVLAENSALAGRPGARVFIRSGRNVLEVR